MAEANEAFQETGTSNVETVQLSAETLKAVGWLRTFYHNNRPDQPELTLDQVVRFATVTALACGQRITRSIDGTSEKKNFDMKLVYSPAPKESEEDLRGVKVIFG